VLEYEISDELPAYDRRGVGKQTTGDEGYNSRRFRRKEIGPGAMELMPGNCG
jgi:hypothetical protein